MTTDTTPEAEKRQHEIFMRLSGEQKARLAMEFSDTLRAIAWAGFRQRHHSVSEMTLRSLFFREVYGIESLSDLRAKTMDESDFLKRLADKLAESGISFMLVGSVAASYHGHLRSTFDIDIVVDADGEALRRFARALGEGYYVSEDAICEAVRTRTAFNIIDEASGCKADLIVRKERPFSRTEFGRRTTVNVLDKMLEMATPEDVILSKLEWSKLGSSLCLRHSGSVLEPESRGRSERQLADALQVARTQGVKLDPAYIDEWSQELGVADLRKGIRDVVFP
jgi:hypothetical protein